MARGLSALDAAGAGALEFDEPSELHELGKALLVAQSGDHAGEVSDRGDRGPDPAAERLAVGGAAQVVVAARPRRLRNELQLPVAGLELVHGLRGGLTVFRRGGHTHRVGVAVENLTDELYAESSNVSFFRPEPARNVTLTYQVSF